MGAGNVARNGQAQTHAAFLQVAAFVEAVEWAERFLAPVLGNAGTVVADENLDEAAVLLEHHIDMRAVLQRIVDQIGGAAPKRIITAVARIAQPGSLST